MSCDSKQDQRCCRTDFDTPKCPSAYKNLSSDGYPGNGCVNTNEINTCHQCVCAEQYCCSLGSVCNGWRGETTAPGAHTSEWC
mmetsp:Transcript_13096/g.15624  ORF Transcript_13096/g.15624 Transcript_13096/m.15624 type:complete len:83 (+) Transcript_13096:57-305(+)